MENIKEEMIIFVVVCLLGLFCSWIGGVQPFTFWAGVVALFTILCAGIGAISYFVLTME